MKSPCFILIILCVYMSVWLLWWSYGQLTLASPPADVCSISHWWWQVDPMLHILGIIWLVNWFCGGVIEPHNDWGCQWKPEILRAEILAPGEMVSRTTYVEIRDIGWMLHRHTDEQFLQKAGKSSIWKSWLQHKSALRSAGAGVLSPIKYLNFHLEMDQSSVKCNDIVFDWLLWYLQVIQSCSEEIRAEFRWMWQCRTNDNPYFPKLESYVSDAEMLIVLLLAWIWVSASWYVISFIFASSANIYMPIDSKPFQSAFCTFKSHNIKDTKAISLIENEIDRFTEFSIDECDATRRQLADERVLDRERAQRHLVACNNRLYRTLDCIVRTAQKVRNGVLLNFWHANRGFFWTGPCSEWSLSSSVQTFGSELDSCSFSTMQLELPSRVLMSLICDFPSSAWYFVHCTIPSRSSSKCDCSGPLTQSWKSLQRTGVNNEFTNRRCIVP